MILIVGILIYHYLYSCHGNDMLGELYKENLISESTKWANSTDTILCIIIDESLLMH